MNIKTIASAVLAAVVLCAAPAFADGKMNLNTATEQELYARSARKAQAGRDRRSHRRRGMLVLTLIAGGPGKGFPHRTAAEADKNSNRIASRLHSEGG